MRSSHSHMCVVHILGACIMPPLQNTRRYVPAQFFFSVKPVVGNKIPIIPFVEKHTLVLFQTHVKTVHRDFLVCVRAVTIFKEK